MSSSDPCKCEDQKPGYGGMCKTCGKECFRQEEESSDWCAEHQTNEPHNDYRCWSCHDIVLYRRDHKPSCQFYSDPLFVGRQS